MLCSMRAETPYLTTKGVGEDDFPKRKCTQPRLRDGDRANKDFLGEFFLSDRLISTVGALSRPPNRPSTVHL